jgi:hypothetical protein
MRKTNTVYVSSMNELDNEISKYFSKNNSEQISFVSWIWHEYGFLPIYFNDFFKEFFEEQKGKIIGTCFEGHQIFYENKVDYLIILKNFIDSQRAYKNNKETILLLQNFKIGGNYKHIENDRGIAYWNTIKNFSIDEYDKVISKYKFTNILHHLSYQAWEYNLFPGPDTLNRTRNCIGKKYKYASGEKDYFIPKYHPYNGPKSVIIPKKIADKINTELITLKPIIENSFMAWDLEKWINDPSKFDKIIDGNYSSIFVKNSWKTCKFKSKDISDFITNENGTFKTFGLGNTNFDFVSGLCRYYIKEKKKLVLIDDLVSYRLDDDIIDSEYIIKYNMKGFLDVRKLVSIAYYSQVYMTSATSPLDLALYYCKNTNLVYIDKKVGNLKKYWVELVQLINGKKSHLLDFNDESYFDKLTNFISEYHKI